MTLGERIGNLGVSLVRTLATVVIGTLVATVVKRFPGLESHLDEAEISAWFTPVMIMAWYSAIRWAETKIPAVGWLFGIAKQPGYVPGDIPPAQPPPVPNDEGRIDVRTTATIVGIALAVFIVMMLLLDIPHTF